MHPNRDGVPERVLRRVAPPMPAYSIGLVPFGRTAAPDDFASDEVRRPLAVRLVHGGAALLVVAVAVSAGPTVLLRLHAQAAVRSAEWKLFQAVSQLPLGSVVVLPFASGAEMIDNLASLLRHSFQRVDLVIEATPIHGGLQARPTNPSFSDRFAVILHDDNQNWRLGLRGTAQGSRAQQLSRFEAVGISLSCRVKEHLRASEPWRIWRLGRPIEISFAYNWEIHRVFDADARDRPCP